MAQRSRLPLQLFPPARVGEQPAAFPAGQQRGGRAVDGDAVNDCQPAVGVERRRDSPRATVHARQPEQGARANALPR